MTLLVLTVGAGLSVVVPAAAPVRAPLVFLAALLVPGAALLNVLSGGLLRNTSWPTWLAISFALSCAVLMLGAVAMDLAGLWHPGALLFILAVGSVSTLLLFSSRALPPPRRVRPRVSTLAVLALLIAAVTFWVLSLSRIPTVGLSDYGLPQRLPILWYAAVVLTVAAAAVALFWARSAAVLALALGVLVLVLFATVPAMGQPPEYSWTYKHFGVVQYIEANHGTSFSGDIYQRWPGFFEGIAALGEVAGRADPVTFAGWSEPLFAMVDALLIVALGSALRLKRSMRWGAALMFTAGNWVGQTYFSPQALAFSLHLAFFVLLLQRMVPTQRQPLLDRVSTRLRVRPPRWLRADGGAAASPMEIAPQPSTVAMLIVLQVCISASHQLTPYILVIELVALSITTPLRPRWLAPVIAVIPVLYLLPNLSFVEKNFGIFSGFDITKNVQNDEFPGAVPAAGKTFNALAGQSLSITVWVACAVALFVGLRSRHRVTRILGALFVSPFLMLFGQDYGGEAILRVCMFTLPWAVLAIAAAGLGSHRTWARAGWTALLAVLATLFVPAFYGQAELNFMPTDEVRASAAIYQLARPGSALVFAAPNFPRANSADYQKFGFSAGDDTPILLKPRWFRDRRLRTTDDVDVVLGMLKSESSHGLLVFGTSGYVYNDVYRLTLPGELRNLERLIAVDPRFTLIRTSANVRVYGWG